LTVAEFRLYRYVGARPVLVGTVDAAGRLEACGMALDLLGYIPPEVLTGAEQPWDEKPGGHDEIFPPQRMRLLLTPRP
jgi:hypothetical protein